MNRLNRFQHLTFVLAVLFSTVSTSSLAIAAKTPPKVQQTANKSKTIKNVTPAKKNLAKKVVKKVAKKYPLILVFGTDTCGRTTRMRQQLTSSKITYKYRNLDDPNTNKQMWDMLGRYELPSNHVSLPVVYVKGNVFLNPSLGDIKGKI
jgi:hypothetical protein